MKGKDNQKEVSSWADIKNRVYEFESFKIGLELKKAREARHLTQKELGEIIDKKRTYISRVENDGSNLTLKTLFDIVEKGLGGKVKISIEL